MVEAPQHNDDSESSAFSPEWQMFIDEIARIRDELLEVARGQLGRLNGFELLLSYIKSFKKELLEIGFSPSKCAAWNCLLFADPPLDVAILDFPESYSVKEFLRKFRVQLARLKVMEVWSVFCEKLYTLRQEVEDAALEFYGDGWIIPFTEDHIDPFHVEICKKFPDYLTYSAWHILAMSNEDYDISPNLDFPGLDSVETFYHRCLGIFLWKKNEDKS